MTKQTDKPSKPIDLYPIEGGTVVRGDDYVRFCIVTSLKARNRKDGEFIGEDNFWYPVLKVWISDQKNLDHEYWSDSVLDDHLENQSRYEAILEALMGEGFDAAVEHILAYSAFFLETRGFNHIATAPLIELLIQAHFPSDPEKRINLIEMEQETSTT